MLQGRDIVCISSIDWDFVWQGHQQIMSTLAERQNRVLFIENTGVRAPTLRDLPRLRKRIYNWWKGTKGFWKKQENLFIYSPLVLPFPYSRIARYLNRLTVGRSLKSWMRAVDFSRPIVWTFLPTPLAADIIRMLDAKITIYYCIDNFAKSSVLARRIVRSEAEVFGRSDLVFVTSRALYDRASRCNRRVEIFPFGIDFDQFEKVRALPEDSPIPEEMRNIPRPIAGYIGGIHKWLDQLLIRETARQLPEISFVFIGPIQADVSELRELPNIHFLGERSHEEIPYYVRAFDAGLIPYVISDYTESVYPTKLNEYLAMGKPVVSTDLTEVRGFNRVHGEVVRIARDEAEFACSVEEVVRATEDGMSAARIQAASENSWEKRIQRMSELIQARLDVLERSGGLGWEQRLLAFYRGSSRKLAAIGGCLLLLYGLLLYTPLLWHLSAPLKLVDPPRPSDAIVVFAGGVGESGQPGEGYQERVKHAVDLYRAENAPHVMFSSGYSHTFREAEIMMALAVSLGVPPGAIILETKAGNTYENAKFVAEILRRHGWQSVLLVSSPYHMRRASLTFKKVAPEIRVVHTPVPYSFFYDHTWGANLAQLRGILHEYLGILYYWWVGWI